MFIPKNPSQPSFSAIYEQRTTNYEIRNHSVPLCLSAFVAMSLFCKTNPILKMTKLTQKLKNKELMKIYTPSTTRKTNPNEANVNIGKLDATSFIKEIYEKKLRFRPKKNKAKQTQYISQLNMIKIGLSYRTF